MATLSLAVPPGPVHVSANVLLVASGVVDSEPIVVRGPSPPPDALPASAPVDVHASVVSLLGANTFDAADRFTVTGAAARTATATSFVVAPRGPIHVSEKRASPCNPRIVSFPETAFVPDHAPL